MFCPNCHSIATRIVPNTERYACCDCGQIFGYVVGSVDSCPQCGSVETTVTQETERECGSCGCQFIIHTDTVLLSPHNLIFSMRKPESFFYKKIVEE